MHTIFCHRVMRMGACFAALVSGVSSAWAVETARVEQVGGIRPARGREIRGVGGRIPPLRAEHG